MSSTHGHSQPDGRNERRLWWALALTGSFLVAEVVAAFTTNSLALLSDAAHMATDTMALGIALLAVRLGRRPPDAQRTFGYARAEALGALANGLLLLGVAAYILWESVGRFVDPPAVASTGMLVVAALGLVVNLAALKLLRPGSGESLNMKGAYLEVWGDLLGSAAVIVGALLISVTGRLEIDPLIAAAIGLWVLPRTLTLLREALRILLESAPRGVDVETIRRAILATPGVASVHEMHVWSLSSVRSALAAHVVVVPGCTDLDAVRGAVAERIRELLSPWPLTLQVESASASDCDPAAPRTNALS
jgi:cobalt-zinc-cadmium efflux system protein